MIALNGKQVRGFGVGDDSPPATVPTHHSVVFRAAVATAVGAIAGAGMSYADTRAVSWNAVSYGAAIGMVGALVAIKMQ